MCVCVLDVEPFRYVMDILEEKNGFDNELLIYTMTLLNKVPVLPLLLSLTPGLTPSVTGSNTHSISLIV